MSQPFPNYYLTRPDQVQVPLVPLDELPNWIEVGAWNWSDTSLFETMNPVSCDCIPRSGEYEVICHYCAASVDKLHRSVSQQNPPAYQLHEPQAQTPPPCVVRLLVWRRAPSSLVLRSSLKASCRLWRPFFHVRL
ncbi:hypothetical protein P168DRAFT_314179 [Aspergillus campestris IBT 28561]|uniref:Uncharacterized protein n=1 Tax=Aspergillus campestris (strain IBT 28561) TaxID=1392248 RepID=A0A2I1DDX9_ASPC2|nr:uncharacterized protein P168DRAFT_314179 [Aspergillus campestris IBT 28561]PKY08050.1 hypothetical protein P168DRAFT_314179 [Aspergillus campestris IBT 28561]